MAENKNSVESLDLDELLGMTDDDLATPASDADETVTVAAEPEGVAEEEFAETDEQRTIRELREQLAAAQAAAAPVETEEQRTIRELRAQLAAAQDGATADVPTTGDLEVTYDTSKPTAGGKSILLHFIKDGLIVCGTTWYRGQELEFFEGTPAYEQQLDRNGNSWLDLVDDIDGQFERYGDQYFAAGPWRGRKWTEASIPEDLDPAEVEKYKAEIAKAAEKEKRRGRAAPIMR